MQALELIPKGRCLRAANKQMMYVLTIRGTERPGWEGNLFSLYNILFVAKMLCMILCWNIANLTSFVAVKGRR